MYDVGERSLGGAVFFEEGGDGFAGGGDLGDFKVAVGVSGGGVGG